MRDSFEKQRFSREFELGLRLVAVPQSPLGPKNIAGNYPSDKVFDNLRLLFRIDTTPLYLISLERGHANLFLYKI